MGGKRYHHLIYESSEGPLPFPTKQINRDLAVHTLIDRLPDCYKPEGQAAKQQNLSFVATAAYLLANVKDSSTSGDNNSGQALVAQDPQQLRDGGHFSRSSRCGSSRSNSRNFSSRGITCNWYRRKGHKKRDCWTRLVLAKDVSTSTARPIWPIASLFHLINTHPLPKSLRILPARLWEISTLLRHSTQIPFLLLRGMDHPRQILPI